MFELPRCRCGQEMVPVIQCVTTLPGWPHAGLLCAWCDGGVLPEWSLNAWCELGMLERGSWPRRIRDLLPQVEPPDSPA